MFLAATLRYISPMLVDHFNEGLIGGPLMARAFVLCYMTWDVSTLSPLFSSETPTQDMRFAAALLGPGCSLGAIHVRSRRILDGYIFAS